MTWEDLTWNVAHETFYKLDARQPAATKYGLLLMEGFVLGTDGEIYITISSKEFNGRYAICQGIWTDDVHYTKADDLRVKSNPVLVRVLRSFLEEKLSPKEIVQAEKLQLEGYKLSHRYTGGWMWNEPKEEHPSGELTSDSSNSAAGDALE